MVRINALLLLYLNLIIGGITDLTRAKTNDTDHFPVTVLGQRAALLIKNRLLRRQVRLQYRSREVCYDMLGCFAVPRSQIPSLMKPPQSPEIVDTKFLLLTRKSFTNSSVEWLLYGDNQKSLSHSTYDSSSPTKIIIHGFKGSGQDKGALDIAAAFLRLENANVILVDWQKGAAGPSYVLAAANTQLVGRQLALLLMDIMLVGSNLLNTHIIGFSLGAHIAGYAGRAVQNKGLKIGRITGLDPASPLFQEFFSTSLSPLNKNDATFVDIIHTDGARFFTEGLGIFRPIGHLDYFPNGGFDQPGCNHVRGAVIASHLGGSLNTGIVCNHLRAWQLFLESLKTTESDCELWSFPCSGGWSSFIKGNCFPFRCTDETCAKMGYLANTSKFVGPLFLVTRDSSPFCGHQFKVSVMLSKNTERSRGEMQLSIFTKSETVNFKLHSEVAEELQGGYILQGIGVASYGAINPQETNTVTAHVSCYILNQKTSTKSIANSTLAIDEVVIRDLHGNVWRYAKLNTALQPVNDTNVNAVNVELRLIQ